MIRLLVSLIGLGIRVGGFLISFVRGSARAICRLRWLRLVAQIGLNVLVAVKGSRIASTAIALSVINFGLLMWQIWPEDAEQTMTVFIQPTQIPETVALDNTAGRITELENQILDLSREQRFQLERLRDCINFPSPFGCPRTTP